MREGSLCAWLTKREVQRRAADDSWELSIRVTIFRVSSEKKYNYSKRLHGSVHWCVVASSSPKTCYILSMASLSLCSSCNVGGAQAVPLSFKTDPKRPKHSSPLIGQLRSTFAKAPTFNVLPRWELARYRTNSESIPRP